MEYAEAKEKYIQAWGALGTSWGINRAMAQIHALLLISEDPLSTAEIMEELQISRGNVNMNVRSLIDWGIAEKVLITGERKEFFKSDKDIMQLGIQVAQERKRRELDPIVKILTEIQDISGDGSKEKEFRKVTKDLLSFASQSGKWLDTFSQANKNWFFKVLTKFKK